jgi:hypothetical protein
MYTVICGMSPSNTSAPSHQTGTAPIPAFSELLSPTA